MGFNGKMKRQEALSKEDVQLLRAALQIYVITQKRIANDREAFLAQKLERMEKAFRS